MDKKEKMCNNFLFLGFTILELAKLQYYQASYAIKDVFGSRSKAIYGDTDSVIHLITDPENSYLEDMKKLRDWYDFTNLDIDNPLRTNGIPSQKGIPGLWKLVVTDIVSVAAISSKMYSVQTVADVKAER